MTDDTRGGESRGARPSNEKNNTTSSVPVTARTIDPERLALFVEGRLDAAERDEVLAALDQSPELREIYADVIAATGELDTGTTPAVRDVSRATRTVTRTSFAWMALAAGLVIAATTLVWRAQRRAPLAQPSVLVAQLAMANAAQTTPPDAWGLTRGGTTAVALQGRGLRVGAAIADLELLTAAGDSTAPQAAQRVATLLQELPAGFVGGAPYARLANQGRLTMEQLQPAADSAELFVDSRELRVGAWLELVRVAALRGDSAFLASPATRSGLTEIDRLAPRFAHSDAVARLAQSLRADSFDLRAIESDALKLLRDWGT
jgi:hypothetical protein